METTLRRLILIGIAAALSVSALLGIVVVLSGDLSGPSGRVLATTALVGLFSLLALPAGVLLDQGRSRSVAWLSLGLDALGFALVAAVVWRVGTEWEPALIATIFAAALAEICMLQARRRPGESSAASIMVLVASTLALALALMLSAAVLDVGEGGGAWFQLVAVLAIANFLLVLLQPIFRRLGEEPRRVASPTGGHRLLLVVDRLPQRALPGYVVRSAGRGEIECALNGSHDFAGAVAEAIRTLESEGSLVERVERIG